MIRVGLLLERKSQVFVAVLIAFAIMLTLGAAILMHSRSARTGAKQQTDAQKAYILAQNGIEIGTNFALKSGGSMTETYKIGGGEVLVDVIDNGDDTFNIESTADYKDTKYTAKKRIGTPTIPPTTCWAKLFGGGYAEYPRTVRSTTNVEGFIVAGDTLSWVIQNYDLMLLKLDPEGNREWAKSYGGTSTDETCHVWDGGEAVLEISDGSGYILAGRTSSWGAMLEFFVLRLTSSGDITWAKIYGDSRDDRLYSVHKGIGGGFILGGQTDSFRVKNGDGYVVKIYDDGTTDWCNSYGSSDTDVLTSIATFPDNSGYLLCGYTASWGNGDLDGWIIKIDTNGNPLWSYTYGDDLKNAFTSVKPSFNKSDVPDGFILGGRTETSTGNYHSLVVKIDLVGGIVWSYEFGPPDPDRSDIEEVIQTDDDKGYVVGADFYHNGQLDYCLVKLDFDGAFVWKKLYGDQSAQDNFFSLDNAEGGFIIAGGYKATDWVIIRTGENAECTSLTCGLSDFDFVEPAPSVTPFSAAVSATPRTSGEEDVSLTPTIITADTVTATHCQ